MSTRQERARKRTEAEARQAAYDALTPAQKVRRAHDRRGDSRKEITRLQKLLPEGYKQGGEPPVEDKGSRTVDGVTGTVYGPAGVSFPWRGQQELPPEYSARTIREDSDV